MAKDQLLTVKFSVCKFLMSKIISNCNSVLRLADKNGVTMGIKKDTVGRPLLSHLCHVSITPDGFHSLPAFISDRPYFHWTTH